VTEAPPPTKHPRKHRDRRLAQSTVAFPALAALRRGQDVARALLGIGPGRQFGDDAKWKPIGVPGLVLEVAAARQAEALYESTSGLKDRDPALSAFVTISRRQRNGLLVALALLILLLVLAPVGTLVGIMAAVTMTYSAAVLYRLLCFQRGIRSASVHVVTDEEALAADPSQLPRYTVLVPAYREPEVIGALLSGIDRIEYPRNKLEVFILLEEDDDQTLAAVEAADPGPHVRVVLIPASEPRTKPKACNYGLQFATGDLVTIYDAEDRPEPLQLRRAAVAFAGVDDDVVCLQAQLGYFNAGQNRITGWFTAEYVTWFAHFVPGLVELNAPVPLGGTSNHIRTSVLRDLGAWDPYNVTEDADLGIRLHRRGMRTGVLNSITLEEANSDFVNWVKQRSRWYKGYLQTWLVHLRHPRQLYRELGWKGFIGFNLFVGGTPLLSLMNPLFWSMTVVFFLSKTGPGESSSPAAEIEALFPTPWYYAALACWLLGNFAIVYMNVASMYEAKRPELLMSALTTPFYWVMMSMAALKALLQLVQQPSFWEKTTHGLFQDVPDSRQTDEADRRMFA